MNAQRKPLDPNAMRDDAPLTGEDAGQDLTHEPTPDVAMGEPANDVPMDAPLPKKRFSPFKRSGGGMSAGGMSGYGGSYGNNYGGGNYGGYGGGKQVGQERTEIETHRYTTITSVVKWGAILIAALATILVVLPLSAWLYLSLKNGHFQDSSMFSSFFGGLVQAILAVISSSS